jgi:hypothetical protein
VSYDHGGRQVSRWSGFENPSCRGEAGKDSPLRRKGGPARCAVDGPDRRHCGSVGACSQMLVYTSKEIHDVGAIAIVPNVGDAYDNALAESFLDS